MLLNILRMMRPRQWVKNGFVLAPLLFAFKFDQPGAVLDSIVAVTTFVLFSGAVYIGNDIIDRSEDRQHPSKRHRPIASGKVTLQLAISIMFLLFVAGAVCLSTLPLDCTYVMAAYILLQCAYTLTLKHAAIIDIVTIACGFVLRILLGAYAINVPVSPWITATTFLLALFLGFGKRYHEYGIDGYAHSRRSLSRYNRDFLHQLLTISCAATLMTYVLYTVETARTIDKPALVYSSVFVVIGLFRYMQILLVDQGGGEPEQVLLKDSYFIGNCLLWLITTLGIMLW